MKLTRLRIDQFRQFRQPVEITGFNPGLNLFCGPNESGKSTLAGAIRAAFFERHGSTGASPLRPWGDSGAAPEVELEFDYDNRHWHLKKRFLARKRCDLTIGNEALSGEEAEDRLASIFGFQFPGRGASKAEHWGIPGLLWIEQGMGQELRPAVESASEHLKSVLSATLGEVTSSGGDEILQQVEAELGELVTKTGKPRGEFKANTEKLADLQAELDELDQRIGLYQSQVDRLSELDQQQAQDEVDRPWETLRQQQRAAEKEHVRVQQLEDQQARDRSDLTRCQEHMKAILSQLQGFQDKAAELTRREQARDRLRHQLSELEAGQTPVKASLESARKTYEQARDLERQARSQARRQELERQQQSLCDQCRQLAHSLAQARELEQELQQQQQAVSATSLDPAGLKKLEALHADWREQDIRQQSIATRLEFDLVPGQQGITLNGEALNGQGEQRLLQEAELQIEGVGHLRITPGGQDLAELARKLDRAQEQFKAELALLGVTSLEQARQRLEQNRALLGKLERDQKLLAIHAPEGTAALARNLAQREQQRDRCQADLSQLPAAPATDLPAPEQAEQRLDRAATELRLAEEADRQLKEQTIKSEQALDSARGEYENLKASLNDPARLQQEQDYSHQLKQLRAEESKLEASIQARAGEIASAHPEILKQDIERFRNSADQLEQSYRQRNDERIHLRSRLESQGADGLEERRGERAMALESLSRRQHQMERRAEALGLLARLLSDKRRDLTRQLQAPLQAHLNHYLKLLFPGARLEVNESLVPEQLVREGEAAGDFDALSFGAREQMGLISRLAYADLLRESGRPTLIILDDALVHSDQARLDRMKRILFDASQRHQVLMFSCHPEKWQDMGVKIQQMSALAPGLDERLRR